MCQPNEKTLEFEFHLPFNGKLPVRDFLIFHFWDSTMVPDIEELGTGQEALVEEKGQWRLDIEWVGAGQSYQSRVAGYVRIWGLLVDV